MVTKALIITVKALQSLRPGIVPGQISYLLNTPPDEVLDASKASLNLSEATVGLSSAASVGDGAGERMFLQMMRVPYIPLPSETLRVILKIGKPRVSALCREHEIGLAKADRAAAEYFRKLPQEAKDMPVFLSASEVIFLHAVARYISDRHEIIRRYAEAVQISLATGDGALKELLGRKVPLLERAAEGDCPAWPGWKEEDRKTAATFCKRFRWFLSQVKVTELLGIAKAKAIELLGPPEQAAPAIKVVSFGGTPSAIALFVKEFKA